MSGVTFADVDGLKELYDEDQEYQDHIQSSIHNFLRKAGDGEVKLDGNYWNIKAVFGLNESYGMINDYERLPDPGLQKSDFAKYRPKLGYNQMELTTFAGTRGHNDGRVGGEFTDDYVKGSLLTFLSNTDSDTYGNGYGYRATILTATPAASSFTVEFSTRLRSLMRLDWYDSTLTTKRGSIQISIKGVDRMQRTVYIDSTFGTGAVPTGATAGDVLVVYGALAAGAPADGRYAGGLSRVTDNSVSLGGLSASTYAAWMATNINAGGANPSEMLLQQLSDSIYVVSGSYADKMSFNPVFKRGYLEPFLNQRRFTSNTYDTGASSLSFTPVKMGQDEKKKKPVQMEMLEDKNHDPKVVYMWANMAMCIATDYTTSPQLADEDGAEFRNKIGFDSLQAFYRYWWNVIVRKRNAIGSIYDLAVGSYVI